MHFKFNIPAGILPKPANGYTYGPPDANGCVSTWAHNDMYARLAVFAAQGPHQKQYADFYVKKLNAQPVDQVDGIQSLYPLDAGQAAALQHGTANTRFINVSGPGNAQSMPALDANNSPTGVSGCAWQGPNAQGVPNVNLDNLPDAYAQEFQHNLNKGADGS